MACYHPLKGYDIGLLTINNKPSYKIVNFDTCLYDETGKEMEYVEIPCGRCIGCRLAYSRMWADRCIAEATLHEDNFFVTLTYNDENLPIVADLETGEIKKNIHTLDKRDVQLFFKRLRKNYSHENNLRFFMAGEYGSTTARPHYHAIIFGLKLDDLKLYKKTSLGFNLYNSQFLENTWGKGYVVVAEVTWETCAYTARYILKKQTGEASEIYKKLGIIPEFTLMSRRPGIARKFFEENKLAFLNNREKHISTKKGGRVIKSTKYFDKLLDAEYIEERENYKKMAKEQMKEVKKIKLSQTSNSYLGMLEVEEDSLKNRIKALPRKEI